MPDRQTEKKDLLERGGVSEVTKGEELSFEDALERMETDILSGVLRARERLVQLDLCNRYNTNRSVIRRVLKELESRMLVKNYSNRGAIVAEPSIKESEDIFSARVLLEGYAIEVGMSRIDKSVIREAEAHAKAFEKAVKTGSLRESIYYNRLFHRTISGICGNDVIREMIYSLQRRCYHWHHYIVDIPEKIQQSGKEHEAMVACLKKKDVQELRRLNDSHLASGHNSYMKGLRRRLGNV